MLAMDQEDDDMVNFLREYMNDIQSNSPNKRPWKFEGAWKASGTYHWTDYNVESICVDLFFIILLFLLIHTDDEIGFNVINNVPCNIKKKEESNGESRNPNVLVLTSKVPNVDNEGSVDVKSITTPCNVTLNQNRSTKSSPQKFVRTKKRSTDKRSVIQNENDFDDNEINGELFECEESETPLLPLYLLRDEGTIQWVLFSDLCYVLKLKSKEALLKQVRMKNYYHLSFGVVWCIRPIFNSNLLFYHLPDVSRIEW